MSMVPINLTLALSLLVVVICGSHCETKDIFNDYLKRPKLPHYSYYHRQNRKWLQTVNVEAESTPDMVLEQLKWASSKADTPLGRKNYDILVSIADGGTECQQEVVDLIISIYAQRDLPRLKPLENFLDHFVRQKFHHCTMKLNDTVGQWEPDANELEIDQFFKGRLRLAKDSSDFEVLNAIRGSNRRFQLNYDQCSDLIKQFGNILNTMNLASAVGLHADYSARLLKLNEYNRFCPSQMISGDF